jgi:hypothetical protein
MTNSIAQKSTAPVGPLLAAHTADERAVFYVFLAQPVFMQGIAFSGVEKQYPAQSETRERFIPFSSLCP